MDGQEYLNQISMENRPMKKSGGGFLTSKFFMLGLGAVILFIIIVIIGAVLSGAKGGEKEKAISLKLHFDNTLAVIDEYQPKVKSSALRSSSASLGSVISDTDSKLGNYLKEKYNLEEKNIDKKLADAATLEKDGLEADLFEAKINGMLDQVYAYRMAYEIATMMNEESKILNITKNETLKEIMSSSYDSLEKLYDNFNDFSEAK